MVLVVPLAFLAPIWKVGTCHMESFFKTLVRYLRNSIQLFSTSLDQITPLAGNFMDSWYFMWSHYLSFIVKSMVHSCVALDGYFSLCNHLWHDIKHAIKGRGIYKIGEFASVRSNRRELFVFAKRHKFQGEWFFLLSKKIKISTWTWRLLYILKQES